MRRQRCNIVEGGLEGRCPELRSLWRSEGLIRAGGEVVHLTALKKMLLRDGCDRSWIEKTALEQVLSRGRVQMWQGWEVRWGR